MQNRIVLCIAGLLKTDPSAAQQSLQIYSREKYLTASKNNFTARDNADNIIDQTEDNSGPIEPVKKMLENFALSILSPDKNKLFADEIADLNNMAVIESAYLSARTAMPEEPLKILNMVNAEPKSIWASAANRIV